MAAFKDAGHFWWKRCSNCQMAWFIGDKPSDVDADEECARCEAAQARINDMLASQRAENERLRMEVDAMRRERGGMLTREQADAEHKGRMLGVLFGGR